MYKRVVVPLDGSILAEAIIPFVLEIAGPLDLDVVLVRVLEPVPTTIVDGASHVMLDDVPARTADAEAYLAGCAAELAARGVRARTQVRRGDPVTEIVAAAGEVDADLIAMTTHGRGGLGRLLFGSVAEALLRRVDIPLFLMRQTEAQLAARAALPQRRGQPSDR